MNLRKIISASFIISSGLSSTLFASDETITGSLTLNPATAPVILNFTGPSAYSGTNAGDPGMTLSYHDAQTGIAVLKIYRAQGEWQWQIANPGGDDRMAMKLGNDHALTLFDPADFNNTITIQPGGDTPGITVNGSPLLTQAAASAAFMSSSPDSITMSGGLAVASGTQADGGLAVGPGAHATGGNALAVGQSQANAPSSVAIGGYIDYGYTAVADGVSSFAQGSSHAVGESSVALGFGSTSNGVASIALAGGTANGWNSIALSGGISTGYQSLAVGLTTAQGLLQTTLGRYNVLQGSSTDWVDTDDLLTLGNGTDDDHRSNALVVKKNGEVHVTGPVLVPPQGDISMGGFQGGPQP